MTHLGILAVCEHYPRLSNDPGRIAPRLHAAIEARVGLIERLSVFYAHDGERPGDAQCDAWLVSGPLLDGDPPPALTGAIVSAAHAGRPLLAIWHGEHLLQTALTGQAESYRMRLPLSVRNPVAVFTAKDQLLRWCEARGQIVPAMTAGRSADRAANRRNVPRGRRASFVQGLSSSVVGFARIIRFLGARGA